MDKALKSWEKLVGKENAFNSVTFSSDRSIGKTDKWRYWRVNLVDGTKVTVVIGDKDAGKAQIVVNHEKISDKKAADHWKSYWKDFLKGLTIKIAAT